MSTLSHFFHTQVHTGTLKLERQQDVKALESNRSTRRHPSSVPFPAFMVKAFIRHFDNWILGSEPSMQTLQLGTFITKEEDINNYIYIFCLKPSFYAISI